MDKSAAYVRTQRGDAKNAVAEAALTTATSEDAAWKETSMDAGNATPSRASRASLPTKNGKDYA